MRILTLFLLSLSLMSAESAIPAERMALSAQDVFSQHGIDLSDERHHAFIRVPDFGYPPGYRPVGGSLVVLYEAEERIGWIEVIRLRGNRTLWGMKHSGRQYPDGRVRVSMDAENWLACQWQLNAQPAASEQQAEP